MRCTLKRSLFSFVSFGFKGSESSFFSYFSFLQQATTSISNSVFNALINELYALQCSFYSASFNYVSSSINYLHSTLPSVPFLQCSKIFFTLSLNVSSSGLRSDGISNSSSFLSSSFSFIYLSYSPSIVFNSSLCFFNFSFSPSITSFSYFTCTALTSFTFYSSFLNSNESTFAHPLTPSSSPS